MLEALIRITDSQTKLKAKGDIVAVKLTGSPWGYEEKRRFLVVEMKDDALEAQLNAIKAAGEPYPVITNPYAEYDGDEMIVRSSKKLDFDKLSTKKKEDTADLTKEKEILKSVTIMDKTKDEKPDEKVK
jgi:hypothetical protein